MEALKHDSFCIDKFRSVGELTTSEKIKDLEFLIEKKDQTRLKIDEELEQRTYDRFSIRMQLEGLPAMYSVMHLYHRRNEIQHLQRALDEYNRVDELQMQIKFLLHRLKNGRHSLAGEKRILREIKCLEDQKESFCGKAEAKKWIPSYFEDTLNSKDSIQNQLKLIFDELKGSMRDQRNLNYKFDRLNKRLLVVERHISSLEKKLDSVNAEMEKLHMHIVELNKCCDDPCPAMN